LELRKREVALQEKRLAEEITERDERHKEASATLKILAALTAKLK